MLGISNADMILGGFFFEVMLQQPPRTSPNRLRKRRRLYSKLCGEFSHPDFAWVIEEAAFQSKPEDSLLVLGQDSGFRLELAHFAHVHFVSCFFKCRDDACVCLEGGH